MKRGLRISPDLSLPIDEVVEGVIGIIGKRGRGKTASVKVLLEELCKAGRPFIAFDPVGVLWGIRSSIDGKGEGYKVLVIGGQHGDLRLDRRAGAEVAKAVVQANVPCIIDFSEESKSVYRQFVQEFSDTLYRINDTPRHVVIEEAPELIPQRLRPDMTNVFEAVERLVSRGRNKGIGVTLISQRAATVNKDVLSQVDTLIVFGLTSPQDRKALREWVEAKADIKDLKRFEEGLAGLKRQEAWVWSPEAFSLFQRIRIRPMTTFHPDKTHLRRMGLLTVKPVQTDVSSIVSKLNTTLAHLAKTEQHSGTDRALTAKIRELERQLAQRQQTTLSPDPILQQRLRQFRGLLERMIIGLKDLVRNAELHMEKSTVQIIPQDRKPQRSIQFQPPVKVAISLSTNSHEQEQGLTPAQRRILETMAQLRVVGISTPSKTQVALWTGVSPRSGGYFNNLSRLHVSGFIKYLGDGQMGLTDEGIVLIGDPRPSMSVDDFQQQVLRQIGPSRAKLLEVALARYPHPISKPELAEEAGVSPTSGGYFNNLSWLRSYGVIEYQHGGVKAHPVMFLEESS